MKKRETLVCKDLCEVLDEFSIFFRKHGFEISSKYDERNDVTIIIIDWEEEK